MSVSMSFANSTAAAGLMGGVAQEFFKGLGRMFYIISPQETFYEYKEDVPNFFRQSWPYFFLFMLMEHCLLRLEGKKGIRLNDGLTSISNSIFQECGRLCWRGAESFLYTWIYSRWRLFELPWDSALTWYAAAVGVDFCYYWMHRACHEVHILWAQHQVHHTSEDFNMGVGIRQSALQGWCGFIFYLPLAFFIPPAQFVMHQQFNYMYMFWTHTEAIRSLGPLEYIFNTPSHHRVHHGCNRYCIDVNYGGVLIIWDRLFGTFRPEREKDEIIYGLIYNQPSFNPLHLQTFYSRYVIEKVKSYDKWCDKVKAIVYGPSWYPGSARLGNDAEKIEVEKREKYEVKLPAWYNAYLVLHYAIVLYSFHDLASKYMGMSPLAVVAGVTYVLGSLTVIGMLFDGSVRARALEVGRCSALAFLASPAQPLYVASAAFWALYELRRLERAPPRKAEQPH